MGRWEKNEQSIIVVRDDADTGDDISYMFFVLCRPRYV